MKDRLIDFFIIGTHKAGTETLLKILNSNPDIYCPEKEMHYFERDYIERRLEFSNIITRSALRRRNSLYKDYYKNFSDYNHYPIWGEKTPSYLYSRSSAVEIKNYNPDAKIIVSLREPSAFLASLHAQNIYNLLEPEKDLAKALRREFVKVEKSLPRSSRAESHMLDYWSRVNYAEQLNRYLKVFPRKNIHIIIFESLIENYDLEVASLYRFLGARQVEVSRIESNPRKALRFPTIRAAVRLALSSRIHELFLSKNVLDRLSEFYNKIFLNHQQAPVEIANQLREYSETFATRREEVAIQLVSYGYTKAAEEGNADAQGMVGVCYADGFGVVKNSIEGYAWYNIAIANGDEEAKEWIKEIELSPEQLIEAQSLSTEIHKRIEANRKD